MLQGRLFLYSRGIGDHRVRLPGLALWIGKMRAMKRGVAAAQSIGHLPLQVQTLMALVYALRRECDIQRQTGCANNYKTEYILCQT